MLLPPQGFRHAVDLLLKNRVRNVQGDADSLAQELVALGEDMKATPDFAAWVMAEFERVFQRPAPASLAQLGATRDHKEEPRDLFLIYVPEDRLPIAAPLAVELAKRRVSVAFSEYEVDSDAQLTAAVARGLRQHRAGVVLSTPDFFRRGLPQPPADRRLTILAPANSSFSSGAAEALVRWLSKFNTQNLDFTA